MHQRGAMPAERDKRRERNMENGVRDGESRYNKKSNEVGAASIRSRTRRREYTQNDNDFFFQSHTQAV